MYRFTIRDVLWLTVVVALGVGWWLDHKKSERRIADLLRYIQIAPPSGGVHAVIRPEPEPNP